MTETCVALYDFAGSGGTTISFSKGDRFVLLSRANGDWWQVELNGQQGFVPSTYVKVEEVDANAATSTAAAATAAAATTAAATASEQVANDTISTVSDSSKGMLAANSLEQIPLPSSVVAAASSETNLSKFKSQSLDIMDDLDALDAVLDAQRMQFEAAVGGDEDDEPDTPTQPKKDSTFPSNSGVPTSTSSSTLSILALPEGWSEASDANGKTYFYNRSTKETSWTRPTAKPLPENWRAVTDANGKTYFFNSITRETSWSPPVSSEPAAKVSSAPNTSTSGHESPAAAAAAAYASSNPPSAPVSSSGAPSRAPPAKPERPVTMLVNNNLSNGALPQLSVFAIPPAPPEAAPSSAPASIASPARVPPAAPAKPRAPPQAPTGKASGGPPPPHQRQQSGDESVAFMAPPPMPTEIVSPPPSPSMPHHHHQRSASSADSSMADKEAVRRATLSNGEDCSFEESNADIEVNSIAVEGYLCKKNVLDLGRKSSTRGWITYYVLLAGPQLAFFKDHKTVMKARKANQPLKPMGVVNLVGSTADIAYGYTKRKNVFSINTRSGTQFYLQTDTNGAMMNWIAHIQHVLKSFSGETVETVSQQMSRQSMLATVKKKSGDDDKKSKKEEEERKKRDELERKRREEEAKKEDAKKQKEDEKLKKLQKKEDKKKKGTFSKSSAADMEITDNLEGEEKKQTIKKKLMLFFSHRPTMDDLKQEGLIQDQYFGSTLSKICEKEKSTIPNFVRDCVQCIERTGMDVVGIYRLSGSTTVIQKLRYKINNDEPVNYDDPSWEDVNTITGALKLFFRELSEPLIPFEFFDACISVIKNSDTKARVDGAKAIVRTFPAVNHQTLRFIIKHLAKITTKAEVNKMFAQNLGIVFGPTLMKAREETMEIVVNMGLQTNFIEFLIAKNEEIFD